MFYDDSDYDYDRNDQDGRLDGDAYCDEVERKAMLDEQDNQDFFESHNRDE